MGGSHRRNSSGLTCEVDLHGLSSDQAEMRILRILDENAGHSGQVIRFIHGKGTGILADVVQRLGQRDPRVASVERSFLNPGMTSYTLSEMKKPHVIMRVNTPTTWEQSPPPVRKRKR